MNLAARIQNLIIGLIAAVVLISLLAYVQGNDARDEQAARVASK